MEGQNPGLRERKKVELRHRIRAESLRLFTERGYDAVSIEDIAAAANVSRTTFFNYFPTKDAVIREPEPGERERWLATFDRPADELLWDSLVFILLKYAEEVSRFLVLFRVLSLQSPVLAEMATDRKHPFYRDLREWVEGRTKPGDELEAALVLNVALAAAETAFSLWDPTVDFAVFLQTAVNCLDRAGAGVAPQN